MQALNSANTSLGAAVQNADGTAGLALILRRSRFPALLLFVFLLFALRRPDALTNPQFWAEDGIILFVGQLTHAGVAWLLQPYRGYLIVNTKLMAALGGLFPILYVPLAFNLIAMCIASLACSLFSLRWYRYLIASDILRIAICIGFAGAIYTESLVDTLNNSQWYMALLALLVLVRDPSIEYPRLQSAVCALLALLAALSNPVLVIAAPICIWLVAKRWNKTIALAILSGICIQVIVFLLSQPLKEEPVFPKPHVSQLAGSVVVATIYKVVINSVAGWKSGLYVSQMGSRWLFYAVLAITLGWLTWTFLFLSPRKRLQALVAGYLAISSIVLPMRGRGMYEKFLTTRMGESRGEQYFFIAGCLFLFLLALTIERICSQRRAYLQAAIFGLVLAGGFYYNFRAPAFPDFNWPTHAEDIAKWQQARKTPRLLPGFIVPQVGPGGWFFELPPTLPIHELAGFPDHLSAMPMGNSAVPFPIGWKVIHSGRMEYINLPALFDPHTTYQVHALVRCKGSAKVSLLVHGNMSEHNLILTAPVIIQNRGEIAASIRTGFGEELCIHLIRESGDQPSFDSITFNVEPEG